MILTNDKGHIKKRGTSILSDGGMIAPVFEFNQSSVYFDEDTGEVIGSNCGNGRVFSTKGSGVPFISSDNSKFTTSGQTLIHYETEQTKGEILINANLEFSLYADFVFTNIGSVVTPVIGDSNLATQELLGWGLEELNNKLLWFIGRSSLVSYQCYSKTNIFLNKRYTVLIVQKDGEAVLFFDGFVSKTSFNPSDFDPFDYRQNISIGNRGTHQFYGNINDIKIFDHAVLDPVNYVDGQAVEVPDLTTHSLPELYTKGLGIINKDRSFLTNTGVVVDTLKARITNQDLIINGDVKITNNSGFKLDSSCTIEGETTGIYSGLTLQSWVKNEATAGTFLIAPVQIKDSLNTVLFSVFVTNVGSYIITVDGSTVATGETLAFGKWYHLALTLNNGTYKVFLSGRKIIEGATVNNSYDLTGNKFVAEGFSGSDCNFEDAYLLYESVYNDDTYFTPIRS